MKKTTLKTNANATAIANAILQLTDVCTMYSLSESNFNTAIETSTNKLFTVNEDIELAQSIIESMNLDDFFIKAVSRCEFYIDNVTYTCYIGAVYTAMSALADIEQNKRDRLTELFNKSLDVDYNKRVVRQHEILSTTETRHKFTSIDEYIEFITLVLTSVVARKQQTTDSTAQQTETAKKTAEKTAKQKRQQKNKAKEKKIVADFSKVDANELAQLTREIIESEMKAK